MSSPTSTIQLLGGLLSLAPGAAGHGLAPAGIHPVPSSSGDFHALWTGMTRMPETSMPQTPVSTSQRQADVDLSGLGGSDLPSLEPEQVLKQVERLLLQSEGDSVERLENALDLLRQTLQSLLPSSSAESGVETADSAPQIPSDDELRAFIQWLYSTPEARPVDTDTARPATDEKQSVDLSLEKLLVDYLERKVPLDAESQEDNTRQAERELYVRQLWIELEAARAHQAAIEKQAARVTATSADDTSPFIPAQQASSETADAELQNSAPSALNQAPEDADAVPVNVRNDVVAGEASEEVQLPEQGISAESTPARGAERSVDVLPPVRESRDGMREERSAERTTERNAYIPPAAKEPGSERVSAEPLPDARRVAVESSPGNAASVTSRGATIDEPAAELNRRQEATVTQNLSETARVQTPAPNSATAVAQAHNSQDALMQKMLNPAWSRALGERAVMMAQQGPRIAEVRLDPPELGSLRIRVQIHGNDQVSLSFNAPNAAVREVLEQSLPRLREMFNEQGMNLADASVSDQSAQEHSDRTQRDERGTGAASAREEFGELPASRQVLRKVGIIDYYA
ncbi:MAG: flagellar hook-length control protein FliK [Nitrincola lacisaponensis]|uniref:flagellar hook-length control protein FliK n=1 Tax=Nitrincola lacisaponensis TaxID=267850 RepID=UPI0039197798